MLNWSEKHERGGQKKTRQEKRESRSKKWTFLTAKKKDFMASTVIT
jgi:hypothetical protein